MALNLILCYKGILQQNSFSRNLNFYFSIYTFFRQSDLLPLVGMAACLFQLTCPLCAPSTSPHAASEPPMFLGSAFTGFLPALGACWCGSQNQVLSRLSVGQSNPGSAGWPVFPHTVFMGHRKLPGWHSAGSLCTCFPSMLVARPCVAGFCGVQMLVQSAGKPRAEYRLLQDSKGGQGV